MARIVELTHSENVTLVPGAVQNWVDLDRPGARSRLLHDFVRRALERPVDRCLVVGPYDLVGLHQLAEQVGQLVVVVRSIPDAARIGAELPQATVLCGTLEAACAGHAPYDLVVALDDVTRVLSLEADQHVSWRQLALTLLTLAADEGAVLLGIENELGLHRVAETLDPRMADDDANWCPLATWDGTRPRTTSAVERLLAGTGRTGAVHQVFPTWSAPTVAATAMEQAPPALRALLTALAGRPETAGVQVPGVLHRRALALADTFPDACAGWVLVLGESPPGPRLLQSTKKGIACWTGTDTDRVRRCAPGEPDWETAVPPYGATLLVDLVEAFVDSDTPRLRRLLPAWRTRLDSLAVDGILPAAYADARFANLLAGDDADAALRASGAVPLMPADAPAPMDEVVWSALGDLLVTVRASGLRHPWPSSMHPRTVFETLVAMSGAEPPQDSSSWFSFEEAPVPELQTRQELLAVVERQREELRGAWSRFHWDETDYLAHKASRFTARAARFVRREGIRGTVGHLRRLRG